MLLKNPVVNWSLSAASCLRNFKRRVHSQSLASLGKFWAVETWYVLRSGAQQAKSGDGKALPRKLESRGPLHSF